MVKKLILSTALVTVMSFGCGIAMDGGAKKFSCPAGAELDAGVADNGWFIKNGVHFFDMAVQANKLNKKKGRKFSSVRVIYNNQNPGKIKVILCEYAFKQMDVEDTVVVHFERSGINPDYINFDHQTMKSENSPGMRVDKSDERVVFTVGDDKNQGADHYKNDERIDPFVSQAVPSVPMGDVAGAPSVQNEIDMLKQEVNKLKHDNEKSKKEMETMSLEIVNLQDNVVKWSKKMSSK